MERRQSLRLGVVLERRRIDNPWQEFSWRPLALVAGAAAADPAGPWTVLREAGDRVQYLAGTLNLELFHGETEAYKVTLSQEPPRLFVVLRRDETGDAGHEVTPFLVTASPYEAQEYLDASEDIVEAVAMPPEVVALVRAFVERHHVDVPFEKRKRKRKHDGGAGAPGDGGDGHG